MMLSYHLDELPDLRFREKKHTHSLHNLCLHKLIPNEQCLYDTAYNSQCALWWKFYIIKPYLTSNI